MNFNPQNEQGILGLVAALRRGMDPSAATGMYQMIQQDQAAQIAQRQQRLSGLAELLMGAATQGMPYAGAEALAEAAPGPAGPAVQQMLASLYPTGEAVAPAQPMSASGQPIQAPAGYYDSAGGENPMMPGTPNAGPQAMSPTFQPPQPSVSEQLAMQEAETEQALSSAWMQVQQQLSMAKAKGYTPDQAVAELSKHPEYAAVFSADPGALQKMLQNLFGSAAVSMAGAPGLGG